MRHSDARSGDFSADRRTGKTDCFTPCCVYVHAVMKVWYHRHTCIDLQVIVAILNYVIFENLPNLNSHLRI